MTGPEDFYDREPGAVAVAGVGLLVLLCLLALVQGVLFLR